MPSASECNACFRAATGRAVAAVRAVVLAAVLAAAMGTGCATGEVIPDFARDVSEGTDGVDGVSEAADGDVDEVEGDAGVPTCDLAGCLATCAATGFPGGHCEGETCICDEGADADTDGDADAGCVASECNAWCTTSGCAAGLCSSGLCQCAGCAADADADAPDDSGADAGSDGGADADADADADSDVPLDGGTCGVPDFPVQIQCRSGFKCTIESVTGSTATPICDVAGTVGHNALCTPAAPPGVTDTCQRFYYCVSDGVEDGCLRFCASDASCAGAHGTTRSGCTWTMGDGAGGSVTGVRFCSVGCDARTDTGCRPTQACRPVGISTGTYTDCSRYGTATQGASCALGGDTVCARRHACLGAGAGARCWRFCFSHSDCSAVGATSKCLYSVSDSGGADVPGFDVCSEQCDPLSDTVCTAGRSCRIGSFRTALADVQFASACTATGAGGQGASCVDDGGCQAGFTCIRLGSVDQCLRYCRRGGGSPSCGGGATCNDASGIGFPSTVGLCY